VGFVLAPAGAAVSGFIRLEEVSRPQLLYPFWHQRNTAADRVSAADLSLIGPQLSSQSLVGAP
jgi:hypothetical protein